MLEYRIDRARRLIEVKGAGDLTSADFLEGQARLRADPEFDSTFALLADYRAANLSALDVEDLRNIAAMAPFDAAAPRAFVVGSDLNFGLMRMFEAYSEIQRSELVRTFRDAESALSWIEGVRNVRL